jgi:phosphoribosyl 1,2-cyclic phosphodiesterase
MRVRFWGVRGSVPYATSSSIGHGCNTPCVEVVDEPAGRRLILDAGSGIVGAGERLQDARAIPIVLTHYHWDHVQGIPFFAPLYRLGAAVTVWAPALGRQFPDIETMFGAPFFPVPYDRLPSPPSVKMITEGFIAINGFDTAVLRLNHPGGSFAYRIAGSSGALVYATDHEFGNAGIDRSLKEFAAGRTH